MPAPTPNTDRINIANNGRDEVRSKLSDKTQASTLLKLPAEMRMEIWKYLLPPAEQKYHYCACPPATSQRLFFWCSKFALQGHHPGKRCPQILLVNKQISSECSEYLQKVRRLGFCSIGCMHIFVAAKCTEIQLRKYTEFSCTSYTALTCCIEPGRLLSGSELLAQVGQETSDVYARAFDESNWPRIDSIGRYYARASDWKCRMTLSLRGQTLACASWSLSFTRKLPSTEAEVAGTDTFQLILAAHGKDIAAVPVGRKRWYTASCIAKCIHLWMWGFLQLRKQPSNELHASYTGLRTSLTDESHRFLLV
jgi:hypothetical protein